MNEAIEFAEWLLVNYEQAGQIGFVGQDEVIRTSEELYEVFNQRNSTNIVVKGDMTTAQDVTSFGLIGKDKEGNDINISGTVTHKQ